MNQDLNADYQIMQAKYLEAKNRRIRVYYASVLESSLYVLASFSSFYVYYSSYDPGIISGRLEFILSFGMISAIAFIVSVFSTILVSVSPIVALILRAVRRHTPTERVSVDVIFPPPPVAEARRAEDPVAKLIHENVQRSQALLNTAKGRPNALLFAGFVIALVGLVFFLWTLPNSSNSPSDVSQVPNYFWVTIIDVLPRLLMLIFIQVLAGFFLRQYRSAMEDYRYFETVLRNRESQYVSYLIRTTNSDKRSTLKFADEIMKAHEIGLLNKGQSTAAIESIKAEANDLGDIAKHLLSVAEKLKPTSGSRSKSGKPTAS